jgi:hypothetical protein
MKAATLIGALSVSFTLFLFSCTLPHSQTHHVTFEEIGEMAGALSYIHVIIPVNISRLSTSVQHFCKKVTQLQAGYGKKEKYTVYLEKYGGQINTEARVFFQISHLLDLMLKDADNLQVWINSLQASIP